MPLYEYECKDCGSRTEELQRFSDPPLTTCPSCGGALNKLLSAPAFHLKGSGWYATDYGAKKQDGSGDAKPEASGAKEAKASGDSGSGTTSDPAPTGKAAPKKASEGSAAKAEAG